MNAVVISPGCTVILDFRGEDKMMIGSMATNAYFCLREGDAKVVILSSETVLNVRTSSLAELRSKLAKDRIGFEVNVVPNEIQLEVMSYTVTRVEKSPLGPAQYAQGGPPKVAGGRS